MNEKQDNIFEIGFWIKIISRRQISMRERITGYYTAANKTKEINEKINKKSRLRNAKI